LKNKIPENLINPWTGNPLFFDPVTASMKDTISGELFPLVHNIPLFLPKDYQDIIVNTPLHKQEGTTFNYLSHYMKDGKIFDYYQDCGKGTEDESRRIHQTIIQGIPNQAVEILDVGCGNAWLARKLCPKGKNVISLDVSIDNAQKALENYPYQNHKAVVADVYKLPFANGSFDCIVASEVLEHQPAPEQFVEILFNLLRPGGVLILTTPYNERIQYSLCVHCNHPTPHHAHLNTYNENSIVDLIPKEIPKPETSLFNNKVLIVLRTYILLQYLPYTAWRLVDQLVNRIIKKPTRLYIRIEKPVSVETHSTK
jgi:2-polyprenyl-3-methyl-5-hydroxy-6-metoxy-1,4-benzoquinol methylase